MTPFRLKLIPLGCVDDSVLRRNIALSKGFQRIEPGKHDHPAAVCGGGPSLDGCLDELRNWPGDIWAINYTADYLLDRGIDCTLYTIDPGPIKSTAARRLLARCCDPSMFVGDVRTFSLYEHEQGGIPGGTTSASRTPVLAMRMGYPGVTFFGCEGSFVDKDHVDRNEQLRDALLIVRANGRDYRTYLEFCEQSKDISQLLREFPGFLKNRSGGLLEAMTHDDQWSVVAVSAELKAALIEANGDSGLYDNPYVEA